MIGRIIAAGDKVEARSGGGRVGVGSGDAARSICSSRFMAPVYSRHDCSTAVSQWWGRTLTALDGSEAVFRCTLAWCFLVCLKKQPPVVRPSTSFRGFTAGSISSWEYGI